MAEYVTIHAFVRAPYDSYVHDETRFWNASGVSIKLGGTGVEVQMESFKALLLGGVAFETPAADIHTAAASENHIFPLFADRDIANAASYTRKIAAISYFPGSVSGLAPGAAVTVHGLKVGEVTDVRLTYDPAKDVVLAPVRYEVEPERVVGVGKRMFKTDAEGVDALLKKGLRASLQSASLITGQQNVALEFDADAPPAEVTMDGPDYVIPATEGGGFSGLTASATELLNKVNQMPFDQIGKNLDGILKSVNDAAQGPAVEKGDNRSQRDDGVGPEHDPESRYEAVAGARFRAAEDIDERQQARPVARQRLWRQHQVQPRYGPVACTGQ